MLEQDPELEKAFRKRQKEDSAFASSPRSQLSYIYEHTPWAEETYLRYPVFWLWKGGYFSTASRTE